MIRLYEHKMANIYVDDETRRKLDEIKRNDPDFNKSKIFRDAVDDYHRKESGEGLDEDYIGSRKKEASKKRDNAQEEVDHYNDLLEKARKEKEERRLEEEKNIEQDQNQKEELYKNFVGHVRDFTDIEDNQLIDRLAKEFSEIPKEEREGFGDFMINRGYSMKEEIDPAP
jgi:hypothetical protein|tara:strand:+ start:3416 stop:3925 length:510 start_codon:yes stop_codon:yes gene_type:complete